MATKRAPPWIVTKTVNKCNGRSGNCPELRIKRAEACHAPERRGWMATFMAKWSRDWPGQSGHLHLSLADKRGRPAFHDSRKPHHMSDAMRWFIGGQQML